jgi:hypothetical protein
MKQYSFCENVCATSTSRWHIRLPGPEGIRLGGMAPKPALCGYNVHWDLIPTPTKNFAMHGLNQGFVCVKCAKIFLEDYEGYRPH